MREKFGGNVITDSTKRAAGARLMTLILIFFSGMLWVEASTGSPQTPRDRSTGARVVVSDLEASCSPEAVQAVAANLTGVTVKEIANGPKLPRGAKFVAAKGFVPAYCQVSGIFVTNPSTSKTANFLATFPAAWNRKYLQIGCSGHCGNFIVSNAASPQITITSQGYPGESIIKGYASFATDEGHESMAGGAWAVKGPGQIDQDAVDDFYYRADKVLAQMGKEFTTALYSRAIGAPQKIDYSYFSGCSGGGRDALVAASFFPEEFDGIISGSPYANIVGVAFQTAGAALAMARSEDSDVPPELMAKVDPIVKAKCDALDGVKDGLIQNPAACDFRPERDLPRCEAKATAGDCFTKSQIESISTLITAVTDEHGIVVQPGYSVSELQAAIRMPRPKDSTASEPWPADAQAPQAMWGLADAVEKIFVHHNDPDFHTREIIKFGVGGKGTVTNFHTIVPQAEDAQATASARLGIGAQPVEMAKLIKEKRKLLIWANLSDQLLTPYMSVNYYKTLAKTYGGYTNLQSSVRLFLIPDTAHCSMSGCGPDNFDALTAMEDWVEKGNAPDSLLAKQYERTPSNPKTMSPPAAIYSKPPIRTMPLCKFPEMAHYSGQGDVKDAVNWNCPPNDTSMLKVGESGRQAGVIQ